MKKKSENVYEIPETGKMKVPGIVYASEKLVKNIEKDKTLEQVRNVAKLPGILKASYAMPDAHQGYGFPIGGVAAFSLDKGIVSPGGVGYDINCGVRLLKTGLSKKDFLKQREKVTHDVMIGIPSGVGRKGKFSFTEKEIKEIMEQGVRWMVGKYAEKKDLERIEDSGCIKGADSSKVSGKAIGRGRNQLGTLGAGNHFIEIQVVDEIFDKKTAGAFGLKLGEVVIMIHSGSRGLGHQVASDYIKKMESEYGFKHLPDRELAAAPLKSKLAKDYLSAMRAAANFAFCNRQFMTYKLRDIFKKHFGKKIEIVYDIAHNIVKFEKYKIDGKMKEVCVHRKGATRSFGPGRKELGSKYKKTGCPVLIPGSMGTFSYVLVGTKKAEELSWGSTAHGAGRLMSRKKAMQELTRKEVESKLKKHDVYIEAGSNKGVVEEAPEAYKDINEVVRVSSEIGLGKMVAKLKPLAVVKG
ncbi:RNA-splicing ligase RtcB [Candidatus Pacearchaeota archaeon CG10_big_fil_rev_8_21_14_0_10_35_219]|nr:RtcB family protein [Candidatus Pacearchaeota archaeon]OIO43383.1 MAG: RNA-splicing ligase RtcB [Candidatus Pacearchaeota archaeon CG1_02_35_32]PIO08027.1 MAG: RNA-splicing ligase RtcB [Candidatus Pacearchaeota archaeon CG10_big_fil_rev_8_21_14_0_10_35_219]PIY81539.1 MAG: RNA-splicing ligase RtcB [Candidatus Pacearchaeota archaeon CG_4_10_14_0_8_um_filter_35_169]PIZ78914.1 MAG: RNA-splicing ligase RtcB [Candidatus Pacearchaeota archaeon CG_4_10_14_0_2_um_filter_35_33]PJA69711.1 MAG: RNA-spl